MIYYSEIFFQKNLWVCWAANPRTSNTYILEQSFWVKIIAVWEVLRIQAGKLLRWGSLALFQCITNNLFANDQNGWFKKYILNIRFPFHRKKKSVSSWEENKFQNFWILCKRKITVLCPALVKCHLLNYLNSQKTNANTEFLKVNFGYSSVLFHNFLMCASDRQCTVAQLLSSAVWACCEKKIMGSRRRR